MTEIEIYGKEYKGNNLIACVNYPTCDAYVGTHSNGEPLGRLANKKLRKAKKQAHYYFDKLWKEDIIKRSYAYSLLSLYLNIPGEYTHIGMFKESTCNDVAEWANHLYQQQAKRQKK